MKKCLLSIFVWLFLFTVVNAQGVVFTPSTAKGTADSCAGVVANQILKTNYGSDSFNYISGNIIPIIDTASSYALATRLDATAVCAAVSQYAYSNSTYWSSIETITSIYNSVVVDGVSGSRATSFGETFVSTGGTYSQSGTDRLDGTLTLRFTYDSYIGLGAPGFTCVMGVGCGNSNITAVWNPTFGTWGIFGTVIDENGNPQYIADEKIGYELYYSVNFVTYTESDSYLVFIDCDLLTLAANTPSLGVTAQEERVQPSANLDLSKK